MPNFNFGALLTQENQVKQIPIDNLLPYHNHKFHLYEGERLEDMVASVKENGILVPIIVQPAKTQDGFFEILSGHNRSNAARLAGLPSVPAVIKEKLTDQEAEMYVIETNLLQRGFDDLLTSEKATVLALRYSEMFSQGKRNDIANELKKLENSNIPEMSIDTEEQPKTSENKSVTKVGNEYGLSKNTVARLLRINKLTTELKSLVDQNVLSIRAGVNLSYINYEGQKMIYDILNDSLKTISITQSKDLKELYESEDFSLSEVIKIIMQEDKKTSFKPIKIKPKVYSRFFTDKTEQAEIESTIEKALEMYFAEK